MYVYICLHYTTIYQWLLFFFASRSWCPGIHKSIEKSKARPALVFPSHGKQPSPVTTKQQLIQQTASPNSFGWEIHAFLFLPFWLSVAICFNRVKRMLMDVACLHASHCTASNQHSEYLHIFTCLTSLSSMASRKMGLSHVYVAKV